MYHYNDDPKTPVYEWATTAKSAQDVLRILLMEPSLATTCTRIPTSTCDDVCLLLDTNKLKSREDWKCDDMGAWKNNGVQRHTLSTPITEEDDSENSRDKRTHAPYSEEGIFKEQISARPKEIRFIFGR